MLDQLKEILKYSDGIDHPEVGTITQCHIKDVIADKVIDVTVVAIRQRFMSIGLFLSVNEKIIGVMYKSKTGYESRSFVRLGFESEDRDLSLILTQLGFPPDGD